MQATASRQTELTAQWLGVFVQADQVTELRALNVGGSKIVTDFFDGKRLPQMAERAVELERAGASGVYFTPNPLRPDMATSKRAARDQDVIARHWILIDVDPVRPEGLNKAAATEGERQQAWEVLDRCRNILDGAGFHSPVVGDSGNGWHLCYPVDLANDDGAKEQVRQLLRGLQKRCGTAQAKVDTSTFNASRIWKLYGTLSRKGQPSAERPHRRSRLVEWSQQQ